MVLWMLLACTEPVTFAPVGDVSPRMGRSTALPFAPQHPKGVASWTASIHGQTFAVEEGTLELPATLPAGPAVLTLEAYSTGWFPGEGQLVVGVDLDLTPPAVTVSAPDTRQGHTLAVEVEADEELGEVEVLLGGEAVPTFLIDGRGRALAGIALDAELGATTLVVNARDEVGNLTRVEREITILEAGLGTGGFIQLTDEQAEARKPSPELDAMRETRSTAHATVSDTQRWRGRFQAPCTGRRSSKFGRFRTYSDGASAFHEGVDIANAPGTAIHAAADGTVLVADAMPIYGNVIIVDHGQGVISNYNHLQDILVAVGDDVQMGQRIGKMGTTGQSTGPHLHFEVHVAGEAVQPDEWLQRGF